MLTVVGVGGHEDMSHAPETDIPSDHDRIRDQAAHWSDLLRHRGGDLQIRQTFEQWRAQDPAHAAAFARLDAAHRAARSAKGSVGMAELTRQTKARAALRRQKKQKRQRRFAIAASFAVAAFAGLAITGVSPGDLGNLSDRARHALAGEQVYLTAVGERRAVTLDDGTVVTLNTDSRAVVRMRDQRRDVALTKGQALFEVARDTARPFVVTAGNRTVTALGTAFDVRVSKETLEVLLIEGKVAVAQQPAANTTTGLVTGKPQSDEIAVLKPGDQLVVAMAQRDAAPEIRRADVDRAVSWREGHLIFHSDRLEHVIAEINRYRTRPLVLADTALGDLRISGVVNTANTAVFVETMTTYYPLKIVDNDARQVVLGPRG